MCQIYGHYLTQTFDFFLLFNSLLCFHYVYSSRWLLLSKKNKIFGWDKRPYIRDFSFILLYIKHYSFYWQLYDNKAYITKYTIHNSLPPYKLSKSLLVITTVCTVPAFKQLCKMCLTPSVTVSISLGSLE